MTRKDQDKIIARNLPITGNTYAHRDAIKGLGCAWHAARKMWFAPTSEIQQQAQQLVGGTLYNSPPPADLTGDEKPADLAAKFGREAVAGAKAVSFSCYGLAKGEQPQANGSIRRVRGTLYVQVAHSPRRYLSREMLEDFDLFSAEPGGSYDWQGVAVVETAEEIAAVTAAAEAKAAIERPKARRKEIERLVRCIENHVSDYSTAGMTQVWGDSRMAGSESIYSDGKSLLYITSDYDMGPSGWRLNDESLAQEAMSLATAKK